MLRRVSLRLCRGQRPTNVVLMVMLLILTSTSLGARDAQVIGRVKVASGSAWIVRDGQRVPAKLGESVVEGDRLETSQDGRLGVTLADNTRVALAANSSVQVDEFVLDAGGEQLRCVLRIVRGIVAYVSGQIAKYSPDAVQLQTPETIIGVRGTTLAVRVGAG